jgi:hypothetical protein
MQAMKTANIVSKSSKSSDTSVNSFDAYVSKLDTTQQKVMRAIHAEKQAKGATKEETKKGIFKLVAGTIVKIENKMLKKAIDYHCKQGNLAKVETGVKLTAQGANRWTTERVSNDPAQFNEIAKALHSSGEFYKAWNRQPATKVNKDIRFPNPIFWGSFARTEMRQAFAAIFAK